MLRSISHRPRTSDCPDHGSDTGVSQSSGVTHSANPLIQRLSEGE